jgi:hypothetical protein
MPIEKVPAELRGEDGKVYSVELEITPKNLYVDPQATPVRRIVDKAKLSPASGSGVPDGKYELTYTFEGKPQKDKVRMRGGQMFGGW